jgi:hypothetical protein
VGIVVKEYISENEAQKREALRINDLMAVIESNVEGWSRGWCLPDDRWVAHTRYPRDFWFPTECMFLESSGCYWGRVRKLTINIVGAQHLPSSRLKIRPDPFVTVQVGNDRQKTVLQRRTFNPLWVHQLDFEVEEEEMLRLVVWDWNDVNRDEEIGYLEITAGRLVQDCESSRPAWNDVANLSPSYVLKGGDNDKDLNFLSHFPGSKGYKLFDAAGSEVLGADQEASIIFVQATRSPSLQRNPSLATAIEAPVCKNDVKMMSTAQLSIHVSSSEQAPPDHPLTPTQPFGDSIKPFDPMPESTRKRTSSLSDLSVVDTMSRSKDESGNPQESTKIGVNQFYSPADPSKHQPERNDASLQPFIRIQQAVTDSCSPPTQEGIGYRFKICVISAQHLPTKFMGQSMKRVNISTCNVDGEAGISFETTCRNNKEHPIWEEDFDIQLDNMFSFVRFSIDDVGDCSMSLEQLRYMSNCSLPRSADREITLKAQTKPTVSLAKTFSKLSFNKSQGAVDEQKEIFKCYPGAFSLQLMKADGIFFQNKKGVIPALYVHVFETHVASAFQAAGPLSSKPNHPGVPIETQNAGAGPGALFMCPTPAELLGGESEAARAKAAEVKAAGEKAAAKAAPVAAEGPTSEAVPFAILTLDLDFNSIGDDEAFKQDVIKDVATAANVDTKHMKIAALHAGSVIADLLLAPAAGDPTKILQGLVEQSQTPDSLLKRGKFTCKTMSIAPASGEHEQIINKETKKVQRSAPPPRQGGEVEGQMMAAKAKTAAEAKAVEEPGHGALVFRTAAQKTEASDEEPQVISCPFVFTAEAEAFATMRAASPTNSPRRQGLSVSVENVARIFGERAHPRDDESKETNGNTSDSRHRDWRGVYPVELELVEIKVKNLKCPSVTRYHVGLFH